MKRLALALLILALMSCSTMRKAICPPAHVSTVTETDHTFIVTLEAGCRTEIVVVPK